MFLIKFLITAAAFTVACGAQLDHSDEDNAFQLSSGGAESKSRVNGGQPVTAVIPYQVSLQMVRRGRWRHFCGGSVISSLHILTAAHCVDKLKVENFTIVVGTLNWKSGGERHRAMDKHVHPKFSMSPRIINDIAIVKVQPPLRVQSSHIGTISLGGPSRIGDKVAVRLSGWGSTTPTATSTSLPDQLQTLNYHTISNEECSSKGFRVTPNEICALSVRGQGACVGDSGGPLIVPGKVPQLVGVVSYGTVSCAQGRPDVYMRISSFLNYINKILKQDLA